MTNRRNLFIILFITTLFTHTIAAQQYAWCGYAMLEGLPISGSQVNVIEAITPDFDPLAGQPHEHFQTRFSLNNSRVIIEGCFEIEPNRELIIVLLDQVLVADLAEIDARLIYTVFAPGGTRQQSEDLAVAYIRSNAVEWERVD